jgi:hypothetical protein
VGCADYCVDCYGDTNGNGNDLVHGVLNKRSVLELFQGALLIFYKALIAPNNIRIAKRIFFITHSFYCCYDFDECKVTKDFSIISNNPAILYEMAGLLYELYRLFVQIKTAQLIFNRFCKWHLQKFVFLFFW